MDITCATLNVMKMDDKTLTFRRDIASGQPTRDQANVLAQTQQHIALQASGANAEASGGLSTLMSGLSNSSPPGMMSGMTNGSSASSEPVSKVVCLIQVVTPNMLTDDEEYEEIVEDMNDECGKFGTIVNLVIPRPRADGEEVPGVGKVFVEYTNTQGAAKAKLELKGRKFAGKSEVAIHYSEDKFSNGDYSG